MKRPSQRPLSVKETANEEARMQAAIFMRLLFDTWEPLQAVRQLHTYLPCPQQHTISCSISEHLGFFGLGLLVPRGHPMRAPAGAATWEA